MKLQVLRRLDSHLASSSFLSSASWMNCSAQEVQLFLLAQDWAVQALHHIVFCFGIIAGGDGTTTVGRTSPPSRLSPLEVSTQRLDLLDSLVIHLVELAAWDDLVDHSDQADVEDPEEDVTCARSVELEVLDQQWDGLVDQVAAVCQKVEVNSSDPWD